ncbi:MAG: acyl-CoA/acyl-ACP dehydrogenase [Armatimonadetes bacterium]|nr:acyl-CoA/acyl-ACP dehydrogenase [Armatimonadota bacterium]MDE2206673.1 acyl-CoA/acyl-ACP dehydrogenase [Armatimonadota bacterium]
MTTERTDEIGFPTGDSATPQPDARQMVEAAEHVGSTVLGPCAEATDQMDGPNRANFAALAAHKLLGLAVPVRYGGADAAGRTQHLCTQTLASWCGVTAFTQAQHHGPCRFIANGPNPALADALLPEMAAGRLISGVSFAHLRRPGPPAITATAVPGGWLIDGVAPWVTGWGMIAMLVLGAATADGRIAYFWIPVEPHKLEALLPGCRSDRRHEGTLDAGPPIRLCAMRASATVVLHFHHWFVPDAHLLAWSDREAMRRNDKMGVLGATAFPLGCSWRAIQLTAQTAEKRSVVAGSVAAEALLQEWRELDAAVEAGSASAEDTDAWFTAAVELRAKVIALSVRAAHAAVTVSSGSANTLAHPAQRLYREAMFYTVQAQTNDVMQATLRRLTST